LARKTLTKNNTLNLFNGCGSALSGLAELQEVARPHFEDP
jgi:hypothetical protein